MRDPGAIRIRGHLRHGDYTLKRVNSGLATIRDLTQPFAVYRDLPARDSPHLALFKSDNALAASRS
jgi:hypothetical protein